VPATGAIALPCRRKKAVVASGGCVRVVMTISLRISARLVAIPASVLISMLVSLRRSVFGLMLIGTLLAMLVSMFIRAVLRVKAEWSQAGHRNCAERKYHGPHGILHDANLL
jgi:mannitol-specific phosphotransferase system IIBC component